MMEDISESRAVRLSWDKVCGIVSKEIEEILGVRIQCRILSLIHIYEPTRPY